MDVEDTKIVNNVLENYELQKKMFLDELKTKTQEIEVLRKHISETEHKLHERYKESEKELTNKEKHYREKLRIREQELQIEAELLRKELHDKERLFVKEQKERESILQERESDLNKELVLREKMLHEKEKDIHRRQRELEEVIFKKAEEDEIKRQKVISKLVEKEKELNFELLNLEKEKEKYSEENRKNIEAKSESYVNDALQLLAEKERKYHFISRAWSVMGALAIIMSIFSLFYFTIDSLNNFDTTSDFGWTFFIYIMIRGFVISALFIAFAKYSFIYSNAYMHESLKNSERSHAIHFGKFYLEAYGAEAKWEDIKEAFANWNINSSNAFNNNNPKKFDPEILDKLTTLADTVGKRK